MSSILFSTIFKSKLESEFYNENSGDIIINKDRYDELIKLAEFCYTAALYPAKCNTISNTELILEQILSRINQAPDSVKKLTYVDKSTTIDGPDKNNDIQLEVEFHESKQGTSNTQCTTKDYTEGFQAGMIAKGRQIKRDLLITLSKHFPSGATQDIKDYIDKLIY